MGHAINQRKLSVEEKHLHARVWVHHAPDEPTAQSFYDDPELSPQADPRNAFGFQEMFGFLEGGEEPKLDGKEPPQSENRSEKSTSPPRGTVTNPNSRTGKLDSYGDQNPSKCADIHHSSRDINSELRMMSSRNGESDAKSSSNGGNLQAPRSRFSSVSSSVSNSRIVTQEEKREERSTQEERKNVRAMRNFAASLGINFNVVEA